MGEFKICFFAEKPELPEEFIYPEDYILFCNHGILPEFYPWRFLSKQELDRRIIGLRERYPNSELVPFARRLDCDDIACFKKNATGVEINIIHDFSSPGWEHRGTYKKFSQWLESLVTESIEWHKENGDED